MYKDELFTEVRCSFSSYYGMGSTLMLMWLYVVLDFWLLLPIRIWLEMSNINVLLFHLMCRMHSVELCAQYTESLLTVPSFPGKCSRLSGNLDLHLHKLSQLVLAITTPPQINSICKNLRIFDLELTLLFRIIDKTNYRAAFFLSCVAVVEYWLGYAWVWLNLE